jgi:hypothetical protein
MARDNLNAADTADSSPVGRDAHELGSQHLSEPPRQIVHDAARHCDAPASVEARS